MSRRRMDHMKHLRRVERGDYVTKDGKYWIVQDDPARPYRGWWVRQLTGDFADPEGKWEPMMLDNGLSSADSLRDALNLIPGETYLRRRY